MADTTIGYAVLQIIPSLKGVTDAIDKEIAGHVVPVTIDPKTDAAKIDKSVQDAVKKSKPPEVQLEPKIEPSKIDGAVKDSVKKSKPPEIKIEPKVDASKTKSIWGEIVDDVKGMVSDALEEAGTSVDEVVDNAAKSVGRKVGEMINESRVGHWLDDQMEKVDALRDRWDAATAGVGNMSDAISALKTGDAAGGLTGISNALNAIGQSSAGGTIASIANEVAPLQTQFFELRDGISGFGNMIESLASGSERYGGRFAALGAAVSEFAGPLAVAAAAAGSVVWGLEQIAKSPDPTKGFQSPIQGHEGAPIIPVPGSQPLVATPPAPPGTHYEQKPGSLDPFAALLPAGAGPPPTSAPVLPSTGQVPDMTRFLHPDMPDHAGGGLISGPGTGTSDSILGWPAMVRVSNKEFITNAAATDKNLPLLQAVNAGVPLWDWLRSMPGFAPGGLVNAESQVASLAGVHYLMGGFSPAGLDCSGLVSAVTNAYLGRPMFSSRMSTPSEGSWLASLGALPGRGGPGDLTILWWDGGTGGGQNGHTEAILPNGQVIEAGGSHGNVAIGAGTTSPNDRQWTQAAHFPYQMLLGAQNPQLPGSGSATAPGGPGSMFGSAIGGGAGGGGGAVPAMSASAGGGAGIGGLFGGGGSLNVPSSLSGFGSFAGQQLGQLGQLGGGLGNLGDLSQLGSAAGSFIDGQVSSALNLFGVPGSPGWLKGISTLIGGIRIGGGGSATPLAASPTAMGEPMGAGSATMHGSSIGQQPGQPGVTYNITARDTEDAFIRAQRLEREKAAAKLDRFGG